MKSPTINQTTVPSKKHKLPANSKSLSLPGNDQFIDYLSLENEQKAILCDSIPRSAKALENLERRKHRHELQQNIINTAKKVIKPAYKDCQISKEEYKIIMKKTVSKATYSKRWDSKWIAQVINGYKITESTTMASGGRSSYLILMRSSKDAPQIEQYLSEEPLSSEEKAYYEECREYYYMTGRPLVSISDEIFDQSIGTTATLLKFGIDESCNEFHFQEFVSKVAEMLNINTTEITVRKIQSGSTILEAEIYDKIQSKDKVLKIKMIYNMITDKLQEEFGKLKIFFMYMGPFKSFFKKQRYREDIKLIPQYNRVYTPGQTYWTGQLNDGKDRGKQPYYCPVGWKRWSFYVTDNFDQKFNGWCICYHGTKFAHGLSILLSGLKPADQAIHGVGVYATPSVNYACHPRYSEVKLIDSSHRGIFFKKGKYVQFVLECRVKPKNINRIAAETLNAADTRIDSNISNDIIEWVIDSQGKTLVDFNDPDCPIICTGLMVRVTDCHPGLLPESEWWYDAHVCNNKACCCLGMDLNQLKKQKDNGTECNIILD